MRAFHSLALVTTIFISSGFAQESANPSSLEDIWRSVLSNNLSYRETSLILRRAEKEIKIQSARLLPILSSTASYNYVSELPKLEVPFTIPGAGDIAIDAGVNSRYEVGISLNQPVFTGFRTRNLVKSAESALTASEDQRRILRNQLLLQSGLLFYNLKLSRLNESVLDESIQRARLQLDLVRNLLNAAQATEFDTLEVANTILRLQYQQENIRNGYEILLSQLRLLMNKNENPDIGASPQSGIDISLDVIDEYQTRAIQSRPELRRLAAIRRAQQFKGDAARSSYYPQVFANVGYHYGRPGVNFFKDEWMSYYTAGVTASWQLWDWRQTRNTVQQAQIEVERTRLEEIQVAAEIRQQVEEAYLKTTLSGKQVVLQEKIVGQERQRYQITQDKFREGVATALDVSIAGSSLTEAELLLQQNIMAWDQHYLTLEFAAGTIGSMINEQ